MMKIKINRRAFVTGAAGTAAAALGVTPTQGQTRAAAADPPGQGLRAAVLEHPDRWTKESIGLGELLGQAGMSVVELALNRPADQQLGGVDLIVFGSFTNNGDAYKKYIQQHGQSLQRFVQAGGVVLEMTQSDQFGNKVDYLPAGVEVFRGDRDLSVAYPIAAEHPIISRWLGENPQKIDKGLLDRQYVNWESIETWQGMRVLLASEQNGGSPCLLEAAHGRGRFLVSGLWVDKCYSQANQLAVSERALQQGVSFFAAIAGYVALVKKGKAPQVDPTPMPAEPPTGPMVGHVDTQRARIWFRPSKDHHSHEDWRCILTDPAGSEREFDASLDPDHDFTCVVEVTGLKPQTPYRFKIVPVESPQIDTLTGRFQTPPANDQNTKITLGMGSCAPSNPNHIWTRVVDEGCQGFIFLGDTPYVDTSDLGLARRKHRTFLEQPEIREMIRQMPCWGTWDDHDFGTNDGHGDFPGKHACRAAFTEYRANATFGHDAHGTLQPDRLGEGRGIYTSFRYGPLEVFLLDPRWFSRTEKSWADSAQPTCLGKQQWAWFKDAIKSSDAVFKCIATGMIWDDKKNSEKDDWGTYHYERDALLDFIKENRIPGCFLLGGDIHVSRALMYGPRIGYDLWQFIISPMHHGVIPSLNVPHPNLVHDAVEPYVFLKLEADTTVTPATLKATWINRDGKRIFEVKTDSNKLRA